MSYLRARSDRLVTQNRIVRRNKEKNDGLNGGDSAKQRWLLSERRRALKVFTSAEGETQLGRRQTQMFGAVRIHFRGKSKQKLEFIILIQALFW